MEFEHWECLKMLRGHETEIFTINVISNGKIISWSKKEIKVWDVESGTCLS